MDLAQDGQSRESYEIRILNWTEWAATMFTYIIECKCLRKGSSTATWHTTEIHVTHVKAYRQDNKRALQIPDH